MLACQLFFFLQPFVECQESSTAAVVFYGTGSIAIQHNLIQQVHNLDSDALQLVVGCLTHH